jgi:hypothetical protein
LKKNIQEFIQEKMLAKDLNRLARGDSRKDVIKDMTTTFSFSLQDDDFTNFSSFEALKKAKSSDYPEDGKVIKSKFNFVNKSLLYGGDKYGDWIMIQGGTGVGKSYAGVNEGANCIDQGYKTAHVFLGDMSEYDAWIRYVSYWKNVRASEVVAMSDQESLMDEVIKQKFSNLRVKSYPAEKITVDDLVAKLDSLHKEFPFDMLIVDYDSNLKETDDNSYKELGTTYGTLKGFSKERCVTIIMSQIKIVFWGEEKIPKEAAADSSKKQHAVDAQIGFGRNKKNPILGTAFLSKVRRGITDTQSRVYYDLDFSKITEIKAEKYEEMLNIFEKRTEDIVNGIEMDD